MPTRIKLDEMEELIRDRYFQEGLPSVAKGKPNKFLRTQDEYNGIIFENGTYQTYRNRK